MPDPAEPLPGLPLTAAERHQRWIDPLAAKDTQIRELRMSTLIRAGLAMLAGSPLAEALGTAGQSLARSVIAAGVSSSSI